MTRPAPRTVRALLLAGVAGPLAYAALVVVLGLLTDGYQPIRDSMSELGAVDASHRHIMNIGGFMGLGVTILLFAAGFFMVLRDGWLPRLATGLLVAAGGFMIAVGFFPCDPSCVDVTLTGRLHSITSTPQAIALPLAAMVTAAVLRTDERIGTGWQAFSFWSGVTALATGPVVALDAVVAATGLVQRAGMGLSLLWMLAIAVKLRTLVPPDGGRSAGAKGVRAAHGRAGAARARRTQP
jgi:hypothetical membrane protein